MILPADKSRWPERWRELYEERAGIMEYHGKLERGQAELLAEHEIRTAARESENRKSA